MCECWLRVIPGVLCRGARGARVRAWRGGYSSSPVLDLQGQARRRLISTQVDGGRSIVREAGLVDKNAGEAKDAYLFFMERAPDYVAD